jgi:hypothetical protein
VTPPIGNEKCNDTPSASTVHGELPIPDCNKNASPNPKRNKPITKTKTRNGEIAHREGALQGVFGIVRCGLRNSPKVLAIKEPYYEFFGEKLGNLPQWNFLMHNRS